MADLLTDQDREALMDELPGSEAEWRFLLTAVEAIVRRHRREAWHEGFMNAAGQDHPAYPRTRRIANPYAEEPSEPLPESTSTE